MSDCPECKQKQDEIDSLRIVLNTCRQHINDNLPPMTLVEPPPFTHSEEEHA